MFERFGLMDVLMAIRRRKKLWLLLLVLVIVLVGIYDVVSAAMSYAGGESFTNDGKYVSSASYIVICDATGEDVGESGDVVSSSREIVNELVLMTRADFCRQYVLEAMLEKYTPEELLKAADKPSSTPVNLDLLSEFFTASNYNDSMILNIFTTASNPQFAKDLLQAYSSFVTEHAAALLPIAEIRYAGGADQLVEEQSAGTVSTLRYLITRLVKHELIAVIAVVCLGLVAVFFIALFHPTMNRREDFLDYAPAFLGEVPYSRDSRQNR